MNVTQNPKTDTEEIRVKLEQKSGTGDEDDAQEWSYGRVIVAVLRQVEVGARVDDVCRKVGISQATYYLWKRKYTGVGVSELRELRQLRDEVGRLKRLVADLSLIGRSCRTSSQKSCKASCASEVGALG